MKKVLLFVVVVLGPVPCCARIITVDDDGPADFFNIQAAINDADDGDIVLVADGIYTGDGNRDIDFTGRAITVRSIDPNDPNIVAGTIIDCDGSGDDPHRGFYFHTYEDRRSVLAGITVTGGYASAGGGALVSYAHPTIVKCRFTGNQATSLGGGISFNRSSARVANCEFIDNSAYGTGQGGGGGGIHNLGLGAFCHLPYKGVIKVQDRKPVRRQALNQFTFALSDFFLRPGPLRMHCADIGNHADVRFCHIT